MNEDCTSLSVGLIIRGPANPGEKPPLRRAMIATIHEAAVSVIWESPVPQPLSGSFLVTPEISASTSRDDEETTLDKADIQPLLDFETLDALSSIEKTDGPLEAIAKWKDYGDQLLRLGDPSAAIAYYEMALSQSSTISVGATVVCSVEGHPKIAEVDCVEQDGTVDVMFVESGEDRTLRPSEILICVLDDANMWQERIMLNLSRCLLQQGSIDPPNKARYLKAAVLACTLVLSILSFRDPDKGHTSDMAQAALQLRIKAYMGVSKWQHAIADAKRLVKLGHGQGTKLLGAIDREKKKQAKRDKKLVKAISRLVQEATAESVSEVEQKEEVSCTNPSTSEVPNSTRAKTIFPASQPSFLHAMFWSPVVIIAVMIAAFLVQLVVMSSIRSK